MDSKEAALCNLAALEETRHPGKEADPKGDWEGNGLRLGLQWARGLVEFGSASHELGVPRPVVCSAGTH